MTIYTLMPLHQSLGLAVIGLDLSQPIDTDTRENLMRLLAEHLVLVFPDQSLSPAQYVAAAQAFGPPARRHRACDPMPDYPDIGLVRGTLDQHPSESWHTDDTDRERPPAATLLYGVDIPSSSDSTSIADMRAAYWLLSEDERQHLETLRTVNGVEVPDNSGTGVPGGTGLLVIHPMVRTHPVSRERAVYFHPTETSYIEGMTAAASKEYLAGLVARMIQPEIIYDHNWVRGDVLVIDERATLHRSQGHENAGETRLLWRISIEGDRPFLR